MFFNVLANAVLGRILIGLYYILNFYFYFMLITIILSWIPGIQGSKFYQFMRKISDVYIGKFSGWLVVGIVDFTPIIGFVIYELALELFASNIIPMVLSW